MSSLHKPYKYSSFFGTFQVISATLFFMLQGAYAMEPDEKTEKGKSMKPSAHSLKQSSSEESSDSEKETHFNRKSFAETLVRRLGGDSSHGPLNVPQGALKNPQPIQLDVPQKIDDSSMAERRVALRQKLSPQQDATKEEIPSLEPKNISSKKASHVKSSLIPQEKVSVFKLSSSQSQGAIEETEEETHSLQLIDLILKNLHDSRLEVTIHNVIPLMEGIGFEALCTAKSISELAFKDVFLSPETLLALGHLLSRNLSITRLDLSGAKFAEQDLDILGYALKRQKTLRELVLLHPKFKITEQHLIKFYDLIKENQGLRFITWPEDKGTKKTLRALSGEARNRHANPELNRVVLLHRGMQFAQKGEGQDIKTALQLLEKAHKLEHPLAAYEIAKIHEHQGNYDEALEWYKKAQQKGFPAALVKLGDYHRATWPRGNTNNPNYQAAFTNYENAANLGNRKGLYRLGRMYEKERDVPGNLEMAANLFFQSGEKGYCDAFTALGALYSDPKYSGHNVESSKWYLEWATKFKKTEGVAKRLLTNRGH